MKNPDIDIIKNKFLEYIASLIEIKTREKVETEEKIECLNYTTSLLNLINKSKDFFITSLEENEDEKDTFITIMSTIFSKEEIEELLNNIKNIYYLNKSIDLNIEETKPQQIESDKKLNKFIDTLNRYIYRENLDNLSNISKEIDLLLIKISDLATQIELNTEITDIDLLEKLIENSNLTDTEKESLIINLCNVNLKSYKNQSKDEILPLTVFDEKLSDLENLLESEETIKEIISIIEDIPLSKVNIENYKLDSEYTPDIDEYLAYVRKVLTTYLKKYPNSTPEFAYKKFVSKNKHEYLNEREEKTPLVSLVYLKDKETPYVENDSQELDKVSRKKIKETLDSLRSNLIHPKKENQEYIKSLTYGVHTAVQNGINISYIPVTSYYNIVIGVSNKKQKEHESLIESRVEKEEEQIVMLMIDIMREENIDEIKETSIEDEKRVLSTLSKTSLPRRKVKEIEILDDKKVL